MKTNQQQPKLKTTSAQRTPLFSCAFFRHCTQNVLSPTTSTPPPLPHAPPPTHPPPPPPPHESSSSSSSNTSQSFTQWRLFPISNSPPVSHHHSFSKPEPVPKTNDPIPPPPPPPSNELYHVAELQFSSGSGPGGRFGAIQLLEKSLVPNPRAASEGGTCPAVVMGGVVAGLREGLARKPASKVLLALCLVEDNRRVALEAGAVTAVVEALTDAESAVAERALAVLELLCTTAEGAAEVRSHALAVPMMVEVMGRMEARGKEHAISVLAVIYGNLGFGPPVAPAEEVARAVMLALQGECSVRGRRKGAQLLKILQDNGRQDLNQEER